MSAITRWLLLPHAQVFMRYPVRMLGLATGILLAVILGNLLRPSAGESQFVAGEIKAGIPKFFGDWVLASSEIDQVDLTIAANDGQRSNTNPYDEVVTRTYRDRTGLTVMLAVAYAASQEQEVKVHRPELCYPGQGFQQLAWNEASLSALSGEREPVRIVRLLMQRGNRIEAVVYWLRTGQSYGTRAWDGRLEIFKRGLEGQLTDGVLVRASTLLNAVADAPAAYEQLEGFLSEMHAASRPSVQKLLVQ
jgi:EpsI family protein